jgi:maltose alpha-D-glucosyltransferase/alpha-amylase
LLNWMRRAISFRKESPEFGWGEFEVIETNNPKVLAHCCRTKNGSAIAIHNFSQKEERAALELKDLEGFMNMFGDKIYDPFNPQEESVLLMPYGYRWLCRRQT